MSLATRAAEFEWAKRERLYGRNVKARRRGKRVVRTSSWGYLIKRALRQFVF